MTICQIPALSRNEVSAGGLELGLLSDFLLLGGCGVCVWCGVGVGLCLRACSGLRAFHGRASHKRVLVIQWKSVEKPAFVSGCRCPVPL